MIQLYRNERIREIENKKMPIKFVDDPKIVIHIIPHISALKEQTFDIDLIARNPKLLEPIKAIGFEASHTFDGFVVYTTNLEGIARSYVHIMKNGKIEVVEGRMLKPIVTKKEIPSVEFEEEIMKAIPKYFGTLQKLGIKPPFSLFLSLVDVEGYIIKLERPILGVSPSYIKETNLLLDEIFIEDFEQILEIEKLFQPWFDVIWQACGMFKSFNYDEEGNWGYGLNMRE